MADNEVVLADSISYLPEFQAWYQAIKDVLADIDLGELLVYMVDDVDPNLLQYLASQFDVLGYNGMLLALNPVDPTDPTSIPAQRKVVKSAIELHRYKGTEWAIEQALSSIGFDHVVLKKGIAGGYDHWAKFGIDVTNSLSSSTKLDAQGLYNIQQMVACYKRAVCVLEDISVSISCTETLGIDDATATCLVPITAIDNMYLSGALKYDGTADFDGDNNFSGDTDVAEVS